MAEITIREKEYLEREERIKKEIKRLKRIFKKLGLNKKKMDAAISLIKNAAFMTITLEDLQEQINAEGVISTYKNGENQWGTKQSDEVKTYNTMIKNHSSLIKQLTDLLPPEKRKEASDGFEEFVNDRD
jgi:glycerol-3-phosphate responsive antiterminator